MVSFKVEIPNLTSGRDTRFSFCRLCFVVGMKEAGAQ